MLQEFHVEEATLEWLAELGYSLGHGPNLAPGEVAAERESFGDVILVDRLNAAIRQLNTGMPDEACEEALRKVLRVGGPSLLQIST